MSFRPESISFLDHEQEIDDFTVRGTPESGETRIRHLIGCEWLKGAEILCDGEFTEEVTRRLGLSTEHRVDLEATIKGSLGTDFIGKLESTLTGKIGKSVSLTREEIHTKSFPFKGKDCFLTNYNIYQLYSRLRVECGWTELTILGKETEKYWEKDLLIWHPKYYLRKQPVTPADSECGCGLPEGAQVEYMEVDGGKFHLREPFIVQNRVLVFFTLGLYVKEGVIHTFDADEEPPRWPPTDAESRDWTIDPQEALEQQLEPFLMADLPFPIDVIPSHLRFLINSEASDTISLNFKVPAVAGPAA